jgi:hypothetical protein
MASSDSYQKATLEQAVKRYPGLKGMDVPQSHQPE